MILKIKDLREEFGYTQKELADKLNNVQRNVSNWENGTSEPDCATIVALANVFGVTLDELFGRTEPREQPLNEVKTNLYSLIKHMTDEQAENLKKLLISLEK